VRAAPAILLALSSFLGLPYMAEAQTASSSVTVSKAELDTLYSRLDALEQQAKEASGEEPALLLTPQAAERQPISLGGLPGTFEIPGTGLSMAFGGFIKVDSIFSSRGTESPGGGNTADNFVIPGAIPIGDAADGERHQLTLHARESRIWWKAYRETDWGDFNAYLELDFFAFQAPGDERISDSHAPRMRHAYGTLGPLLVGQTWTTFMNASAIPDNLDFVGTVGTVFARQPMLRWTQPLTDGWSVQVALEQPETTITSSTGGRITPGDDLVPDVVAALHGKGAFGNVSVALIGRQLRRDNGVRVETTYGGGVSVAGRLKIVRQDNLRFCLTAGTGLGRYLALNAVNGGYADASGALAGPIPSMSGHVAYQHHWNELFRSSLTASFFQAFELDRLPATATTEQVQSGIINLLFSPIPRTTFGVEYIFARRALDTGDEGILHRGQASAKFVF